MANQATQPEIEQAIDDFLAIGATLEGGLRQQLEFDVDGLQRAIGRKFSNEERTKILTQQLPSYRWTFLVSGLEQENFARAIRDLSPAGLERVEATARALT